MTDTESCKWREDEDGTWWTSCGNGFQFTYDGPKDNGFNYCPYCGVMIESEFYEESVED